MDATDTLSRVGQLCVKRGVAVCAQSPTKTSSRALLPASSQTGVRESRGAAPPPQSNHRRTPGAGEPQLTLEFPSPVPEEGPHQGRFLHRYTQNLAFHRDVPVFHTSAVTFASAFRGASALMALAVQLCPVLTAVLGLFPEFY